MKKIKVLKDTPENAKLALSMLKEGYSIQFINEEYPEDSWFITSPTTFNEDSEEIQIKESSVKKWDLFEKDVEGLM